MMIGINKILISCKGFSGSNPLDSKMLLFETDSTLSDMLRRLLYDIVGGVHIPVPASGWRQ